MISLHPYVIGIISSNPLIRKILPHILNILGQENVVFYASLYEASKKHKDEKNPNILIFDTPKVLDELFLYQDKLIHAYLFVIDEEISLNTFNAKECLDSFDVLTRRIFSGNDKPSFTEAINPIDFGECMTFSEKDHIFKHPNPPKDILTVYKLENPLTMRGVIQSFKSVLPEQAVQDDQSGVTYTLLEKDLSVRLKAYEISLRMEDPRL
ncbi:MAG: hypothetical protein K2X98_04890 [Alphaproteobacteria bacterium]|nr:hypothetical protein [Alphaproteobacteria bacterium]